MGEHKLNILLSAYACQPNSGSEEGVGWNWAINLARYHNVHVITRKKEQKYIEEYMKSNTIKNIYFYYYDDTGLWKFINEKVKFGFYLYYGHWQKKILPIAKEIVDEFNIDIMHHITYNEYRTPGKLCTIDKPFIWGPIGGGHSYKHVLRKAYYKKSDIIFEIVRKIINYSVIYLSYDFKKAIKKSAGILIADPETYKIMPKNREYLRLLETAYYPERNSIKKYNKKNNKTTLKLMYAGVIVPRKGLKLLIDALGESDFRDFKLNIIGDGKDKELIKRDVKRYGMEQNVNFIGKITYDEVNEYYKDTDLFLFPSLRDTSGNVVLEAMSHGVPVIALNHNGASEMITNDSGDLIDICDYEQVKTDFISTIKKYYYNRELLEIKGLNARKRIEEIYNWDYVMNYINKIYYKTMKNI